ncbi:MAG: AMP-binding protein [Firmicutes bacterium]|nr:AMP-binding protein [Bacillota bacterium]
MRHPLHVRDHGQAQGCRAQPQEPAGQRPAHGTAEPVPLPRLKLTASGGAPLPEAVIRAFEARFRATLIEGYGLSEASPSWGGDPTRTRNRRRRKGQDRRPPRGLSSCPNSAWGSQLNGNWS